METVVGNGPQTRGAIFVDAIAGPQFRGSFFEQHGTSPSMLSEYAGPHN